MKYATADLETHLGLGQTTLCSLLLIKRTDGTLIGLTTLDRPLAFTPIRSNLITTSAVTYQPFSNHFNVNKKSNEDGSSATEVEIPIDGTIFTMADLRAGRYDSAQMQELLVNWNDLTQDCIVLGTGSWGPVTIKEYSFTVPLRGLAYRLTATGGETCQASCRVDFFSERCAPGGALDDGTTADSLLQSGTVTSTDGFEAVFVSGIADSGKPLVGSLATFDSGNNNNLSLEVKQISFDDPGTGVTYLRFRLPAILEIAVGDTFKLLPACDKIFDTCANTWNNAVNNQAEPFLPGADNLLADPNWHIGQSVYGKT